jgi:hypothetical protein
MHLCMSMAITRGREIVILIIDQDLTCSDCSSIVNIKDRITPVKDRKPDNNKIIGWMPKKMPSWLR